MGHIAVSRQLIVWMTLALAIVGASHSVGFAAGDDDYNVAVALYQKERWQEAARIFKKFVDENPEHPKLESALVYGGYAFVNDGDYASARAMFERVIKEFPDTDRRDDLLYRLGETSYSLADYERASQEFAKFLEVAPEHELREWALPYLGDAELRLKKYPEAIQHFEATIQEFPQGPLTSEARFGLARAYESQQDLTRALEAYKKIAEGSGDRAPAAQMRVATIHFESKEYEEAAAAFNDLSERFPNSSYVASAQLNAGFSAYRARNYDGALRALESAATAPKNAATATYWIGMTHKAQGQYADAAKSFQQVVTDYAKSPLVAESKFQWADAALRSGDATTAQRLFEEIGKSEPPNKKADAALYFAGEAALMNRDLEAAQSYVEQFEANFKESPYRLHVDLLAGRLFEAESQRAEQSDEEENRLTQQALERYQRVIDDTEVESTENKARYQLARLYQIRKEYVLSQQTLEPLLKPNDANGAAKTPVPDALLLAVRNELALKNYDDANNLATQYVDARPNGASTSEALLTCAQARIAQNELDAAKADWEMIRDKGSVRQDALLLMVRELAERAYANEQWTAATYYFEELVKLAGNRPDAALGLSGIGWSLHKNGEFEKAAGAFGKLLEEFPTAESIAPEAAYMKGKSFQDAKQLPQAEAAFRDGFERFAPAQPVPPGAESKGLERNIYLCGLQLARVLSLQEKVDEADAAYAQLNKTFPQPANLDGLLEEWALLHYEAGNFDKADVLFQRLIDEVPNSSRAASAKLNLAESTMLAGDPEAAERTAKRIVADEAASTQARQRAQSLLVNLAAEQGAWNEVVTTADTFLSTYPDSRDRMMVTYLKGEAQLQLGKSSEAKTLLNEVVEAGASDPSLTNQAWYPRVYLLQAEIAFQEKDYDRLEQVLTQFEAIQPTPDYSYASNELRGRMFKQQTKFDEARDAFLKVVNSRDSKGTETAARAQYGIAETYFLQKNWEEANTEALRVYTLHHYPQWQAPALLMVALTYEMTADYTRALKTFQDVIDEYPETREANKAQEKITEIQSGQNKSK